MLKNPFVISGKIPPEYFCDRVKEAAELTRLLTNDNNVVLISSRRMGKTGLIRHCFEYDEFKSGYYTFFIDILQTSTLREFIFLLGKEIFNTLAPRSRKLTTRFVQALKSLAGRFTFDQISGMPQFNIQLGDINKPEITLEEIFDYLSSADKPCIVAIDEFQQIANYPEKNIEAILRSHIQRSENCRFVFSGSRRHILSEMFTASARPFYNSAALIELNEIPQDIYVDFIIKKFEEKGKKMPKAIAEHIYQLYRGHTFYVQRTCNEAFSYTSEGAECSEAIVRQAIVNILDSYSTIYRETLGALPIKQKELLYAITAESNARYIMSEEFIRKYSLSSASSVQSAARLLEKREIITNNAGVYSVSDRFFALWLQRMLTEQVY